MLPSTSTWLTIEMESAVKLSIVIEVWVVYLVVVEYEFRNFREILAT